MRRLRKERAGVGASVPAFQSQLHRYLPKSCSVPPPCIGLIVSELLSSRRVHSQRNAEEKKQLQDAPGCRKIELWRFAAMGMTLDVSSRRACSQRCSCRDGGGCSSPSCIQNERHFAQCASSGCEASVGFSMRDAWASDPAATSTGADARVLADAAGSFPKEGKEAHTRGILGGAETFGDRTSIRTRRAFEQPWRRAAQRRERASRGPMRSSTRCATHCTPQPGAQG